MAAAPVMIGYDNLFALPEIEPLLREELGRVGAHAARRPAGRALVLQACAANRELRVDTHPLAAVRVHVQQERLCGDVVSSTAELPWDDDAFQLVVAQHAGDVLMHPLALVDELARVLAPGGVLLWYGLNPWSPWLAWTHWRARHGMSPPNVRHIESMRRQLSTRQLTPAAADYIGACWPRLDGLADRYPTRLLAPLRRAYLLTASKQRAVLTPLRPQTLRGHAPARPQLATTPSRRARA